MKYALLSLAALAVSISAMAAKPMVKPVPRGKSTAGFTTNTPSLYHFDANQDKMMKVGAKEGATVDDLLKDPEGTVFSGPYNSETANWTGTQSSDQGRPENPTKFYQYFSGCTKSVNAVRVIGEFSYWDAEEYEWYKCGDRPGYDDKYNMTKPVTFEISFYRLGEDGLPGECVFKKVMPLVGRYTGIVDGYEGNEGPLMEFIAELGEDVKLESGFFSFSAVAEEGVVPTCWFSVFTSDSSFGYGLTHMEPYGYMGAAPCVFSLIGSGEYAATKALRMDEIIAPSSLACGPKEQVRVSITNVGTADIHDVALQLEVDSVVVATERPGFNLSSFTTRDYVFATRVNLTEPGEHVIKVTNVTPDIEDISIVNTSVTTNTLAPGEVAASTGKYAYEEDVLTHVTVGDIDNASEPNRLGYEDFTNLSTNITVGQTLPLTATLNPEGDGGIVAAWVDWNCDGRFDGEGELMGYSRGDAIPVALPSGMSVTPGPKRLRVIGSTYTYELFGPHGDYYYGQTEDYTLNVVSPENAANAVFGANVLIDESADEVSTLEIPVTNEGSVALEATITTAYELPAIYDGRTISKAPANVKMQCAKRAVNTTEAPADDEVAHVLRYDKGQNSAVAVNDCDEAIFGQSYAAEYMSAVEGMKISSIDAYIESVPTKVVAQIYEKNGEDFTLVAEQEFTPTEKSWNHVAFNEAYTISGKEVIYAVKLSGMPAGKYYIGIDEGPAATGYGDLCNVGGVTWWAMSELGINSNFCVRANVTGTRTPELSWLSVDKKELNVPTGASDKVKVTLNRANLLCDTYEGRVLFATNDPLCPVKTIPVYMTKKVLSGIDAVKTNNVKAVVDGSNLVLAADKAISTVRIISTTGMTLGANTVAGNRVAMNIDNCPTGFYVVSVRFVDGTTEAVKLAIRR
ncbi:MAG: GEVED domain-containing protein [Sodaliphilus sp.]